MEGAGIVEAVGAGVTHLKVGDRAAYASNPPGAYSEARVMPAKTVCRLPDAIDFETGAAMMLKGLTAQYLLKKTLPVEGLQAGRLRALPRRGRRRGPDRLPMGQGAGPAADRHRRQRRQVPAGAGAWRGACHQLRQGRLRRARQGHHRRQGRQGGLRLGGQGHLGRQPELPAALRPDGQLRQCLGPGAALRAGILGAKGSLYVTRGTLFTHIATRESTQAMADDLFAVVGSGAGEDPHRPALPAGRGGAGAPRPGSAQDHRLHVLLP